MPADRAKPPAKPKPPPPPDALDQIEAILTLTEREALAMIEARANPTQLEEAALGVMLGKVARLPRLSEDDFERLDRPTIRSLTRSGHRYQGAPVRLKVAVYQVQRWTAGKDLTASKSWPAGRPVWRMNCTSALPNRPRRDQHPLILFSMVDPTQLLGLPDKDADPAAEILYPHGPKIEVAGVFYKIRRVREKRSGRPRDYPMVLAWQIQPTHEWVKDTLANPMIIVLLVVILVMAVAFVFVSRRIRRGPQATGKGPKYEPLRFKMPEAAGGARIDGADAPEAAPREVDPLLAAAAEAYQKEQKEQREQKEQQEQKEQREQQEQRASDGKDDDGTDDPS